MASLLNSRRSPNVTILCGIPVIMKDGGVASCWRLQVSPGDLVAWSVEATGWDGAPEKGEIVGVLVRRLPRRKKRREGRALTPERVEVFDFDGDYFIVRAAMLEAIR